MIQVKNLIKDYGEFRALSDISFDIEQGKIYGFLGPNGAGKSTTLNIITGCLASTSGEVTIGGYDILEEPKKAKQLIGYLPELPPLYMDQTVNEYLTFVGTAKGVDKKQLLSEIESVEKQTGIEDVDDKIIKHLSKGYRQRVGIAQSLLGSPEVIILDEPTVGLDPAQIIEIRDLIRSFGKKHTVIISSHILSEIQEICDEIIIIDKGKIVAFDKTENIGKGPGDLAAIEIKTEASSEEVKEILSDIEEIVSITIKEDNLDGCTAVISVKSSDLKETYRKIFGAFTSSNKVLEQLSQVRTRLEDIFIELTGDSNSKKEGDESDESSL